MGEAAWSQGEATLSGRSSLRTPLDQVGLVISSRPGTCMIFFNIVVWSVDGRIIYGMRKA